MLSVVFEEECPTYIVVCFEYVHFFVAKLDEKKSVSDFFNFFTPINYGANALATQELNSNQSSVETHPFLRSIGDVFPFFYEIKKTTLSGDCSQ